MKISWPLSIFYIIYDLHNLYIINIVNYIIIWYSVVMGWKFLVSSCMRCPTCLSLAEKKQSGLLPFLSKIIFFLLEIGKWKILEIGPVPRELVPPILENRILQVELRIIKILRYLLFLEEGIKDPGPIILNPLYLPVEGFRQTLEGWVWNGRSLHCSI